MTPPPDGIHKPFIFKLEIILAALLLFFLVWGMHTLGCTDSGTEFNTFLSRQIQWALLGILILVGAAAIPFPLWRKNSGKLCAVSLILVLAVTFLGNTVNGMRAWFGIGDIMFQPTEFAKPFFLLFLICLANEKENSHACEFWRFAVFIPFALLLAKQPDFGMLMVYFAALLIVQLLCAQKLIWLLISICGAEVSAFYAISHFSYIAHRFQAFIDPEADFFGKGWHTIQFRIAIAHGGAMGVADGQALWSSVQLPLSHSDSAFAAMCEATGALGGGMVLVALIMMSGVAFMAFRRGRDTAADRFILAGMALCVFQALLHISVNLTVFPITGLTLPFISYGGSSLTAYMLMFGIIFSALKQQRREHECSVPLQ